MIYFNFVTLAVTIRPPLRRTIGPIITLEPDRIDLRLTLAKVYEAAGMRQSVVAELERCERLSPGSERVKQWLKRIRAEGV